MESSKQDTNFQFAVVITGDALVEVMKPELSNQVIIIFFSGKNT